MNFQSTFSSKYSRFACRLSLLISTVFLAFIEVSAQMSPAKVPTAPPQPEEDYTWWYVTLLVLFLALGCAIVWLVKNKRAARQTESDIRKKEKAMSEDNVWDSNSVDADMEMEWFRRHKKSVEKRPKKKSLSEKLPQTGKVFKQNKGVNSEIAFSEKEFKEKLQSLQFNQLPVFKFQKLEMARPFAQLTISSDDALMSAIEQTQDEFEEDEEVRDLAVRILARFRTRNSIESLTQVALYDISSNLRSKAVSILADFDHESVFEAILLACADPTREVRAAAARGLFRLSFDRADAWTRIAETGDEFRMKQSSLAAREADLVKRSFDRLIHQDQKIAYEAVALLSLMIRANETEEIFNAIEKHPETNVKLALLHVIGLTKAEETLSELYGLLEKSGFPKEVKDKIDDVIKKFELVNA